MVCFFVNFSTLLILFFLKLREALLGFSTSRMCLADPNQLKNIEQP